MPRFYVASALPAGGGVYQLTGDAAHRIGRVLRMKPGERLRLFDGSGRELEALIAGLTGAAVTVALAEELPPEPPRPAVHLYQALIRPNRFEWLIEKATELGATAIQPVVSERCQVRAAEFGAAKTVRWGRIVVEAAEQCGRRTLPVLRPPLPFERALRRAPGLVLLPWEDARDAATPGAANGDEQDRSAVAERRAPGRRRRAASTPPERLDGDPASAPLEGDLPFNIPFLIGESVRFRAVFLYNPDEDQALVITNRRLIITGGTIGKLPRVLHLDEVEAVRLQDSGTGSTNGEGNLHITMTGMRGSLHIGGVYMAHRVRNEILAACTDLLRAQPNELRQRKTS